VMPVVASPPQPALSIALLWSAAIALIESHVRRRDAEHFLVVSQRRNQLLRGVQQAEDAERRRLAEQLHDDVLQRMFVARQELEEAADATPGAAEQGVRRLDAVLEVLERTVADLDVDEHASMVAGGLVAALRAATCSDPVARIDVDDNAAGIHDGLIVQLARELYANAVRHAEATVVGIRVARQDDAIVLDFTDDGVGFDYARVNEAMPAGRIGLATVRERATSSGGSVFLGDVQSGGAHVQVRLPVSRVVHRTTATP
jgi:two-component system NarL family sensor kinase